MRAVIKIRVILINVNPPVKAWDSANKHLFSVLILKTTGAAQSVLLQLEPKFGRPGDGRHAWLSSQRSTKTALGSVDELFCVA